MQIINLTFWGQIGDIGLYRIVMAFKNGLAKLSQCYTQTHDPQVREAKPLSTTVGRSTQPGIPPGSLNRVPALIGWDRGGNVTSFG